MPTHDCAAHKALVITEISGRGGEVDLKSLKLAYASPMLTNGKEAILGRVQVLKAEVTDIRRLNDEYSQQRRTLPAQQNHAQRRIRLEQIVEELKALSDRTIQ